MALSKSGSPLLQALGAFVILSSLGAFARAEHGGAFFGIMGVLLVLIGLALLYFGGRKRLVE
jgi:hypothetical protein